ncbi:MAG: hypothetical protein WCG66_05785 [bacterium]
MKPFLPRRLHAWKGTGKHWFVLLAAALIGIPKLRAGDANATQKQDTTMLLQQCAATATGLAQSARNLPAPERMRVTQAALSIVLLTKFNRLLPSLPPTVINQVAETFLAETPSPSEQELAADRFPPADTLIFDGSRLAGGNFRNVDALIGAGGRPIALDRELPAWLVPLEYAQADALSSTRSAGIAAQNFLDLQSLFNRLYAADVGGLLVGDGIFVRPYAGRLDDLYHHLVQKGGRDGQLDYFALLDSLPSRQYSPISGTASRQSVPPLRVRLGNVLSGGSFQAIENFRAANPQANVPNPFKGFAVRALPYVLEWLQKSQSGSELQLSGETMRRAISDPRRYSPGKAPPLFRDPSRFLGQWEDPRYIRVGKKKKPASSDLFAEIQKVDFETPLPEMSLEPAGNALLTKGSAKSKEDDTTDLMRDLGLPPQSERTATYEPPDKPEPVLPLARIAEPPTSTQPPLPAKPAPPLLDLDPFETPPVLELASAPTPEPPKEPPVGALPSPVMAPAPSPRQTPEPVPSATPAAQPIKPSAIAVVPPTGTPTPIPNPTPAFPPTSSEPMVARAIPVHPPQEAGERSQNSNNSPYQVAVLTPTASEAIDYIKKIAASDLALAANLAASRRADCVMRWLGDAVKPFEPLLSETPGSPEAQTVEKLIVEARNELVALREEREILKTSLSEILKAREADRIVLEKQIQTTRRDELMRRIGTGA